MKKWRFLGSAGVNLKEEKAKTDRQRPRKRSRSSQRVKGRKKGAAAMEPGTSLARRAPPRPAALHRAPSRRTRSADAVDPPAAAPLGRTESTLKEPSEHANGVSAVSASGEELPFARSDVVRLMLRSMESMGYAGAMAALEKESGYELESQQVRGFFAAVDGRRWDDALALLPKLRFRCAESRRDAQDLLLQRKLRDAALGKDPLAAVRLLRSCGGSSAEQLQRLALLIACPDGAALQRCEPWHGIAFDPPRALRCRLQSLLIAGETVTEGRLEELLGLALEAKISACERHNAAPARYSLLEDPARRREQLPVATRHILMGHGDEVWAVAFAPQGDLLASASKDGTVIVWRLGVLCGGGLALLERPAKAFDLSAPYKVTVLHFSEDGEHFLTCGAALRTSSAAEQSGAARGKHTRFHRWRARGEGAGRCLTVFSGHSDEVTGVSFLRGGDLALSCSVDKRLMLWDSRSGSCLAQVALGRFRCLQASPDGRRVFAVRDAAGGTVVDAFAVEERGENDAENARLLMFARRSGREELDLPLLRSPWRAAAGPAGRRRAAQRFFWELMGGAEGEEEGMDAIGAGPRLIVGAEPLSEGSSSGAEESGAEESGAEESGAEESGAEEGEESDGGGAPGPQRWRIAFRRSLSFDEDVVSISLCGDGSTLLLMFAGGRMRCWTDAQGEEEAACRAFAGHAQARLVLGAAVGGARDAFVAAGGEDGKLRLWHRQRGTLLATLGGHLGPVNGVAWSPACPQVLVSASDDGTLRVWGPSAEGGEEGGGGAESGARCPS